MFDLDFWLLDKIFEPFAKKFQILFGKNCFFLARIFYFLASINCMLFVYIAFFVSKTRQEHYFMNTFWLLYSISMLLRSLKMAEREEYSPESSEESMNPERLLLRFDRLSNGVIIIIFSFGIIADNGLEQAIIFLSIIFEQIALYFRSCTPLPPCKGKAWETLKGLLGTLKPASINT